MAGTTGLERATLKNGPLIPKYLGRANTAIKITNGMIWRPIITLAPPVVQAGGSALPPRAMRLFWLPIAFGIDRGTCMSICTSLAGRHTRHVCPLHRGRTISERRHQTSETSIFDAP